MPLRFGPAGAELPNACHHGEQCYSEMPIILLFIDFSYSKLYYSRIDMIFYASNEDYSQTTCKETFL